jgi:zinc transport system permease protein
VIEDFLASAEIWRDALAAAAIAGGLCGFLGVYVVLRRTVFVSAALTQISTLGLVAALVAEEAFGAGVERASVQLTVATVFSVAGALLLGAASHRRIPAEARVGVAWVLAGALVVIGSSRLVHAAHDLGGMVFGNAVAVSLADVAVLAVVAAICVAIHAAFAKEILFASFDGQTAAAMGMRTSRWNALLYFTLGLAIPASARVLGALPVFAFLTVPASISLLSGMGLRATFVAATVIGVLAGAGGYVASWFSQLPTGPTMVVAAAVFGAPALLLRMRR